jgi:glyoxylase-like metal-dependent hydrolase (beta-lactamase superfamily II)
MVVKRLVVGLLQVNCFVVFDQISKEAIIIDPGGGAREILKFVEKNNLKIKYIVNTHGHLDHTYDNRKIKEATGAPLLIHKLDAEMLTSPAKNFSLVMGIIFKSPPADKLLNEGDIIEFGNISLKVLNTPGHTPGGISLFTDKVVFVGDTLFTGSVGRTDLPGGSMEELLKGIKEKLLILPDDTIVHPGHGPSTTIGRERNSNPFITGEWY